jgi:replicative DNA helicase
MTRPQLLTDGGAVPNRDPRTNGATRLAERALLDALRSQPAHITDVAGWLSAPDFTDPHHAGVYATLVGLMADGELWQTTAPDVPTARQSADAPTAAAHNELALRQALADRRFTNTEHPDPRQLLANIAGAAAHTPGQHLRYARMILESSVRRQLSDWAVRLEQTQQATDHEPAPDAQIDLTALEDRVARSRGSVAMRVPTTVDPATSANPITALAIAPSPKLVHRAERQIIATVLDPNTQTRGLVEQLTPDDFTADPAHAETWRAIRAVSHRGEPVDAVTVAWELETVASDTAPSGLSADALIALVPLSQPDPNRALTTVARASLAHQARLAARSVQELAKDRVRDAKAVLTAARHVVGTLDEHAARLPATSAENSGSTISRALDHTDQPAARTTPAATPQPGRWR